MNKTITINLSGIVFHIDDNAYEILKQYLEKLKQHFRNTQGKEEIIADIESRIAEMFSEKISESKNVITLDEVNSVIATMGNPEELSGEEQSSYDKTEEEPIVTTGKSHRRLYRNPDDKVLGGVCGGISAYFDIDPVWIRLMWVLLVVFAGTGIFIYIILWVIIPKAQTNIEKLEMRGERVNVNTIEKNVREELKDVKSRMDKLGKEIGSDENKQRMRSTAKSIGDFIGEIFKIFFSVVGRMVGLFIAIISLMVLIGLTMVLFTTAGVYSFSFPSAFPQMVLTQTQLVWLILGGVLLVGIPFTVLLLNGIKLLFSVNMNLKKIGAVMLFFWLTGLGICIVSGLTLGREFSKTAAIRERISLSPVHTNRINLVMNPSRSEWREKTQEYRRFGHTFYVDESSGSMMIRDVKLTIEKSDNDSTEMIIICNSRGRTLAEAKQTANGISYNYAIHDSTLTLSPCYSINTSGKFRAQNIRLILKLPVGKSVFLSKDTEMILDDIDNVTDTGDEDMAGHEWKMTAHGLECVDCTQPQTPKGQEVI